MSPTPALNKPLPAGRYSLGDLLHSEWTKLRTVRSTIWTLALTVVIGLGVSAVAAIETTSHWNDPGSVHFGFDPTALSLTGVFVAQLIIGVLGVMVMSAEYTTGTIRATFSAAPRRPEVLLSKTLVFGGVALVAALATSFLSFFLGQALLTSPAVHATLSTPNALREVLGTALFLCVTGLFALALATIIRHTAGAISAFVAILLVLPNVLRALPNGMYNEIIKFMPSHIGAAILSIGPGRQNSFSPWVGLLIMFAYTVGLLVIGGALMQRRDA
ncbi:MAG TPA: ABC transporter permease [Acidimicrobiales bacterium]|jgi:ABC-type transport system involved in multi-copper enzyme maturation permease subunit|nr:ABC transporter permease [Acidimicrobiales bacterium]